MNPEEILRQFWPPAHECQPFGAGHINDSFRVTLGSGQFVLQRLNNSVFADPEGVMGNIGRVLEHCKGADGVRLPTLQPTRDGRPYAIVGGVLWRLWDLLPGRSLDVLEHPGQARAAAAAYGAFQSHLESLPGPRWADPIPGFFRLEKYLDDYQRVRREPQPFDDAIAGLLPLAHRFAEPNRLIHGDCKVNNVLFDAEDRVCAVLDLDTVMWGHWAWDFGDLARSACARGEMFDIDLFEAVVAGFAPFVPADVDALVLAPCYVAGMLGVRFLTDHLAGDVYFKVAEHGENLHRAATQFAVLRSMQSQRSEMEAVASQVLLLER